MLYKVFSDELRDCCQKWRSYFAHELEASGQSVTKARALIYLTEAHKELSQKELANLLNIEEPSVVRMLDGLEKEGLIERKVAQHDKRSKHISVTTAAAPVIQQIQEIAQRVRTDGLKGISRENLQVAYDVMQMISKNVA